MRLFCNLPHPDVGRSGMTIGQAMAVGTRFFRLEWSSESTFRVMILTNNKLRSGSIPFISHLDHRIRPQHLASIPAFNDPNAELSPKDKAECLAWTSYVEQTLTDLVVGLYIDQRPITRYPRAMAEDRTIHFTLYHRTIPY